MIVFIYTKLEPRMILCWTVMESFPLFIIPDKTSPANVNVQYVVVRSDFRRKKKEVRDSTPNGSSDSVEPRKSCYIRRFQLIGFIDPTRSDATLSIWDNTGTLHRFNWIFTPCHITILQSAAGPAIHTMSGKPLVLCPAPRRWTTSRNPSLPKRLSDIKKNSTSLSILCD